MRRRSVALALALAAMLPLAGCGEQEASSKDKDTGTTGVAYPVTAGGVTLDARPARIISLGPSPTEMLFAIGAGKQVIAVDDQSNYPADAPKTDLSGFQPNAEAVAAKSPDFVVISNDINNIAAQLRSLKIPVYLASAAKNLDDTYAQISDLGKLTGHADEAAQVVSRMRTDIAALTRDLPKRDRKPTFYHELDPSFYSVTSRTFLGSLYALAGLENIGDDGAGDFPQLSAEGIIRENPDMIFLADTKCCQQSLETVRGRAGWADITAVRGGYVFPLDDDIASRWGPRVVDLLRLIVEATAKVPA